MDTYDRFYTKGMVAHVDLFSLSNFSRKEITFFTEFVNGLFYDNIFVHFNKEKRISLMISLGTTNESYMYRMLNKFIRHNFIFKEKREIYYINPSFFYFGSLTKKKGYIRLYKNLSLAMSL